MPRYSHKNSRMNSMIYWTRRDVFAIIIGIVMFIAGIIMVTQSGHDEQGNVENIGIFIGGIILMSLGAISLVGGGAYLR